jgi:hypothetical protein
VVSSFQGVKNQFGISCGVLILSPHLDAVNKKSSSSSYFACRIFRAIVAGSKKSRLPTLTHSQTWSGEQMQAVINQGIPTPPPPPPPTVRTKLQLVDLAGSECVGKLSLLSYRLVEGCWFSPVQGYLQLCEWL